MIFEDYTITYLGMKYVYLIDKDGKEIVMNRKEYDIRLNTLESELKKVAILGED